MAEPRDFPEHNARWWGQGDVGDLPVYQDHEVKISCWRLSWRERIRALLTGDVWLHVWTPVHPAVYVGAEDPFERSPRRWSLPSSITLRQPLGKFRNLFDKG